MTTVDIRVKETQVFSHFHTRAHFMGKAKQPLKAPAKNTTVIPNQKCSVISLPPGVVVFSPGRVATRNRKQGLGSVCLGSLSARLRRAAEQTPP